MSVSSFERSAPSPVDQFVVLTDLDREDELREIAYDVTLKYGLVISVQTQSRERFNARQDTPFVRTVLQEDAPMVDTQ